MQQQTIPCVESLRHGTQVSFLWSAWQKANATKLPLRIATLRKGGFRLVVHQYRDSLCGILKLADVKPRVRQFREWRQPFAVVQQKLVERGWMLLTDSGEVQP